jgi:AAA+ ATPase superfamily predicted ATPase
MLGKVADTMRKYERVGLPEDQVVYLNSGITQIEQMQRFVQKQLSMPDRRILEQIAANWRNIMGNTLTELQSTARINVELKGKEAPLRDEVTAALQLTNIGRGHADDLIVKLAPSDEYDAIDSEKDVGTLLQGRYAQVEFRISPKVSSEDAKERAQIRVAFHIQYNDQRRAGNTQEFADTLTLRAVEKREFAELSPNPYIVGKPVREDELFFGREEDFQYIRQNLRGEYRDNIIILHGQRRTGKTSILYQLRKLLSNEYIPVLIDMQGMLDEGTDAFLYSIATQIYRGMRDGSDIPRPRISDFREQPGTYFRDEFLEQVQQNSNGKSLILMFDEFELLEERVNGGKLDGSIFGYLRNLMQHGEGINFIFSGTHKLEEMSSGYWSILFNIALYRKITFLEREDAEDLIVLPVKDYFDYDPLAIEKIIRTTAGHPHFTQLLCHALVNHRNSKKINYITVQDVTDVMDEVAETGQIHIQYIWRESSSDAKVFLATLLSRIRDLLEEYKIDIDLPSVIESLSNRDVIEVESGHYRFMIDLVRYWVDKNKSMQEVMEEVRSNE